MFVASIGILRTQSILLGPIPIPFYSLFHIGTEPLETVPNYKYLGVVIMYDLDMTATAENLAKAGSHALSAVINKTRSNFDVGHSAYSTLYHSMVTPILD